MNRSLTILFFATTLSSLAQIPFKRAVHEKDERAKALIGEIQGDLFFTTDGTMFGPNLLYRYDATGTLIAKKQLSGPYLTDAKATHDGKILWTATNHICDVMPPELHSYVTLSEVNGVNLVSHTFSPLSVQCVQASDSTIWVIAGDSIFRFNSQFLPLSSGAHSLGVVLFALPLTNGNIAVSHSVGTNQLVSLLSSSGNVLLSQPAPAGVAGKMVHYGNGGVIGLFGGKLCRFSSSLQLISVNNAISSVTDFVCVDDTIYALSGSPAGHMSIDTSLSLINTFSTNSSDIHQRKISAFGNRLAILSDGKCETFQDFTSDAMFAGISVINRSGPNHYSYDLELVAVSVDSAYVKLHGQQAPSDYYRVYGRYNVVVKNNGSSHVNAFALNAYLYPFVACGANLFQEKFTDVNLPSGGTVTVTTSTFLEKTATMANNQVPVDFCFYTTMPNGEPDRVLADNQKCSSISVTVTGLQSVDQAPTVMLFPNPAETQVTVRSPMVITSVHIFASDGSLVRSASLDASEEILDIADLPSGIYLVQLRTPAGLMNSRLIKH